MMHHLAKLFLNSFAHDDIRLEKTLRAEITNHLKNVSNFIPFNEMKVISFIIIRAPRKRIRKGRKFRIVSTTGD